MPLTFGADVLDEGQFAQVICIVGKGDEPLTISWSLQGEIVSSEPSLTTNSLGTRTSMLTIQNVGYRHSGSYTCNASNRAGSAAQSVELRVNGDCRLERKGVLEGTGINFSEMVIVYCFNRTPCTNAADIWS